MKNVLRLSYRVEYLFGKDWILAAEFTGKYAEEEAVDRSRALWKSGVKGVRVLKFITEIHKEAVRGAT